jgi:hypothetical protein
MSEEVDIIVGNQFIMEKRDINIYHHSTGSAHIISQNSSINVTTFVFTHHGDRSLLKIPPGSPTWQLKLTRPTNLSSTCRLNKDNVIVGNNGVS